jgi:glycine/serine hydroxymethyltransferase
MSWATRGVVNFYNAGDRWVGSRSGLIFYRRGVGQKPDGKPFEDLEARINSAVFPSLQVSNV